MLASATYSQPGSASKTFGYLRWEILAAFLNGSVLLLVSAGIVRTPADLYDPARVSQEVLAGLEVQVG